MSAAAGRSAWSTSSSRASCRARSGVRFQTETSAPASRSAHTAARPAPPAPSTSARLPAGSSPSAAISPGASVFSASISPWAKLSVLAAPIAVAAGLAESASARAACLWGMVTLSPRYPAAGSARTVSSNRSGGSGSLR